MGDKEEKSPPSSVDVSTFDIPEFLPSIPSHLIQDCTDREKFVLERISVLIQQNKWQMEMLKRYHDLRNENSRKFEDLFSHKLHNQLREAEEKATRKWKRYFLGVLVLVAYPIYLAAVGELGLLKFVQLFY